MKANSEICIVLYSYKSHLEQTASYNNHKSPLSSLIYYHKMLMYRNCLNLINLCNKLLIQSLVVDLILRYIEKVN